MNDPYSGSERSTDICISFMRSMDWTTYGLVKTGRGEKARTSWAAWRKPFMMICGLTSSSIYPFISFSSCAARRTTLVVPSPTSASWARAMSTSVLAAGWTMSRSLRIVAPSFVICASPRSFTMSLSIPLGPSVVASVSAIARHAEMLDNSCPFPCDVSVPSLRRTTVGCYARWIWVISAIESKESKVLTMGRGRCIFRSGTLGSTEIETDERDLLRRFAYVSRRRFGLYHYCLHITTPNDKN